METAALLYNGLLPSQIDAYQDCIDLYWEIIGL